MSCICAQNLFNIDLEFEFYFEITVFTTSQCGPNGDPVITIYGSLGLFLRLISSQQSVSSLVIEFRSAGVLAQGILKSMFGIDCSKLSFTLRHLFCCKSILTLVSAEYSKRLVWIMLQLIPFNISNEFLSYLVKLLDLTHF